MIDWLIDWFSVAGAFRITNSKALFLSCQAAWCICTYQTYLDASLFLMPSSGVGDCSDLAYNRFNGTIYQSLSDLQYLFLNNNHLSAPFPPFLQQRPNMRGLALQNNRFVRTRVRRLRLFYGSLRVLLSRRHAKRCHSGAWIRRVAMEPAVHVRSCFVATTQTARSSLVSVPPISVPTSKATSLIIRRTPAAAYVHSLAVGLFVCCD